jgi:hypothetical protein
LVRVVFCWLAQPKPAVQASIITAARGITLCFHIQYQPACKVTLLRLVFKSNLVYLLAKVNQSRMPVHLARSGCVPSAFWTQVGSHPGFLRRRIRTVGELPVCWFSSAPVSASRFSGRASFCLPEDLGGTLVEVASAPSPTTAMAASIILCRDP